MSQVPSCTCHHCVLAPDVGSRFRKDNDGINGHDPVIPNKARGTGLHLGGNVTETWSWSEIITP